MNENVIHRAVSAIRPLAITRSPSRIFKIEKPTTLKRGATEDARPFAQHPSFL
jgi:hypothetical protein